MARTARQRAALRKAQLASARKRRGKKKIISGKSMRRRQIGRAVAYAASAVALGVAADRIGRAMANRKSRRAPKTDWAANEVRRIAGRASKPATPKRFSGVELRTKRFSADSYKKSVDSAIVAREKARKRRSRNLRNQRILSKITERGFYNAGLSNNIIGRTFVAGRDGTYRR